uniref:Elongation of very long chain fatty acids protein n=1 Tax=Glossina morsitans morsitans TaxID=37546 RepID=A0A1B0FGS8_GLOMM
MIYLITTVKHTVSISPKYLRTTAQFVLCIVHTARALFSQQCQFSKFISAFLLLNASIFFCLFMNFYIQAYKKKGKGKQSDNQAAIITTDQRNYFMQQKKFIEMNNNNNDEEVIPVLKEKIY